MLRSRLPDGRTPVVLSAHTEDLVRADASAVLSCLTPDVAVGEVAAHLLRTRRIRRHRAVIRAADRDELTAALRAVASGDDHRLVTRSSPGAAGRLAFVFPGQGNQWPGMGAEPYRELPGYRSVAETCAAAFTALCKASPLGYLTGSPAAQAFSEIEIEGAQFVHAVALAHVWQSCGVAPDLTVGHSLGEVAAAYVAGAITLPDAVSVIAARAGVVDLLTGRYAVAALGISAPDASELIAGIDGWLELSVVNAAASVAVSGDRDAVLAAVATVAAGGQFAREITVGFPVHTSILEPLRDGLRAQLPDAEFLDTAVQFVGSAIGDVVAPGTRFVDYWYGNLRDMVRFDRAIATAARCGARSFVELSAHPALHYAINDVLTETFGEDPAVLVGSGRRDEPVVEELSANIIAAAAADAVFDWRALTDMSASPLRGFPNAPMQKVHLWARPELLPPPTGPTVNVDQWQQIPLPTWPPTGRPREVAILALGQDPSPTGALRAALQRCPGVTVVSPGDAETLVVVAPALDQHNVPAAATGLAASVGIGLLRYADQIGPRCRTVCLVTVGAEQVRPQDPVATPGPAALAAMHRSVGFEHPDCGFVHLDLPATDSDLAGVAEALLSDVGSCALRLDHGRPVLLRRALQEVPAGAPLTLDGGLLDDVVITGGTGAIGLQYASYLAERGAKRIVLLSRRGTDPATLAALTERHGTALLAPPCDITEPAALAAVAAHYGGDGASLLIHAAGAATFATAGELTATACADTFAAKLTGLAHVTDIWPLRADARILLCSSVSGVWGGLGHGAYSAANRMLDVQAAQLRATGRHCVAVRWGLWQGAGIVDAAETATVERSGLRPMEPEAAIAASLRDYPADPLVFAADTDRLRIFLKSQDPILDVTTAVSTAQAVRTELASVLSLTHAATLDLDAELFDLGVDSLLAIDLRKRLKRVTGRTVPLATLLGGITGTELVSELERLSELDRLSELEQHSNTESRTLP